MPDKKQEAAPAQVPPAPVDLPVMLGLPGPFPASNGQKYEIRVLTLLEVGEFLQDDLSIGPQIFNFTVPENKAKLEKWVPRLIFKDGRAQTLQNLIEEGWNLADLRQALRRAMDLSG